MGLPGQRRSKSSKRRRASHFALDPVMLSACQKCGKPVLPHHVCLQCGTYNGRQVLSIQSKGEKKLRRREKEKKKEAKEEVTA